MPTFLLFSSIAFTVFLALSMLICKLLMRSSVDIGRKSPLQIGHSLYLMYFLAIADPHVLQVMYFTTISSCA